ncbi:MAG: glycosyltransferase [Marinifilaceae bacterium]
METFTLDHYTLIQLVTLGIFILSFLIQSGYHTFTIRKFLKTKPLKVNPEQHPVSVIICAQNQGKQLAENLPFFLEQDYPNYEVIVVNDCSTDDTDSVIRELQDRYPHLKRTHILPDQKFNHNKKLALSIGIKAAKNEILLFSDPYCRPGSKNWLAQMQGNFNSDRKVVLGYSNIPYSKGMSNRFIRYDQFTNSIKRFCLAMSGKYYSGDGCNLGYCQKNFFENKGFAGHTHIEAGYDHLMVYQLSKANNVYISTSPSSKMENHHTCPLQNWVSQNRHYYQSRRFYPPFLRFLLDLEPVSRMLFYLSFVFLLTPGPAMLIACTLMGVRSILFFSSLKIASSHLKEEKLFLSSYMYDIISLFIKLFLFSTNRLASKNKRWK